MTKCFILLIVISSFFPPVDILWEQHEEPQSIIEQSVHSVRNRMRPLNLSQNPTHTKEEKIYFYYYGLEFKNTEHFFGFFSSGKYKLAAHVFRPENPRGTIFILHGLYDHTGIMKNVIGLGLDMDYTVAIFDLPGHGLSSGEPVSINNFNEYTTAFNNFIDFISSWVKKPYHFIGHSTSCAIFTTYMQDNDHAIFNKIIFLAPLVRHKHWRLSRIGYFITKNFTRDLPRLDRDNSSDPAFNEFVDNDPLQHDRIPFSFVKAIYRWEEQVRKFRPINKEILIIQGTQDDIVDWDYNIEFLGTVFPNKKDMLIEGAKHQLMNERKDIREQVFALIDNYIIEN